jgi:uncharacterized protein YjbI with pentapeptide repeats
MTDNLQRLTATEVREIAAAFSEDTFTDPENRSSSNPPLADCILWRLDLSNLNLTGMPIHCRDFSCSVLCYSNLRGAKLRDANFTGANLRGAKLRRANMRGADMTGTILRDANFAGAKLRRANMRGADMTGAILRDANCAGANFASAILDGANFTGATLRGANLRGANLRDANLSGALIENDLIRQFDAPYSRNGNQVFAWLVDADGRLSEDGTIVINQGCFTGTADQARERAQREYDVPERLTQALQIIDSIEQEMMQ